MENGIKLALEQCSSSAGALSAADLGHNSGKKSSSCCNPSISAPGWDTAIGVIQASSLRNAGNVVFPSRWALLFLTEDQREWEMLGQLSPSPEMSRGANLLGSCSATRKVLFKSKRAQKLPGFWGRTCDFLSIPSHFMLCLMKLRLIFTRSAVPSRI